MAEFLACDTAGQPLQRVALPFFSSSAVVAHSKLGRATHSHEPPSTFGQSTGQLRRDLHRSFTDAQGCLLRIQQSRAPFSTIFRVPSQCNCANLASTVFPQSHTVVVYPHFGASVHHLSGEALDKALSAWLEPRNFLQAPDCPQDSSKAIGTSPSSCPAHPVVYPRLGATIFRVQLWPRFGAQIRHQRPRKPPGSLSPASKLDFFRPLEISPISQPTLRIFPECRQLQSSLGLQGLL